jgi:hypothetical protein
MMSFKKIPEIGKNQAKSARFQQSYFRKSFKIREFPENSHLFCNKLAFTNLPRPTPAGPVRW